MKAQSTKLNPFLPSDPLKFRWIWLNWAFGFFFIASVFGLLMRSFHIWEIPVLEYRNILHTHSHIAMLGWGFLILTGGMVFSLAKAENEIRKFGWLFIGAVVSALGMLASFPVQGYGAVSISFATLHVLISYGFVYRLLILLNSEKSTTGIRLLRLALGFLVISTLGLWALGPINAQLGKMHELSFMSIQWFLHFQLNGWFVLGALGLIFLHFERSGYQFHWPKYQEIILAGSVILTYALAVTWAEPSPLAFQINGLAVLIQLVAYSFLILALFRGFWKVDLLPIVRILLISAFVSLLLKAALQAILVFPSIAVISYTIRMYVIGFLHLVLLGVLTMGISGLAVQKNWIEDTVISRSGWALLLGGFVISELLLFGQGTLIWLKLGFMEDYHLYLFLGSCLFPIGLGSLLIQVLFQKIPFQNISNPKIKFQKITTQTMKKSLLWSAGILGILLTACGGGTEQSATSTETSSAPATEAAAPDPKGIGEIKSVDLGTGIDASLADAGKAIVDMKCTACHQLNDKRLVGPGFQGVTNRRRPEWIMNMITNVDVMLEQDPTAQKLLEECLTRMPNQNLSQADARGILEFMRRNDEEKAGERDAAVK
ncbi:c-type cytochrome [Algoriphagus oliviformis]|nr:c-type cytochrome [Algoriphagus oliviformis]